MKNDIKIIGSEDGLISLVKAHEIIQNEYDDDLKEEDIFMEEEKNEEDLHKKVFFTEFFLLFIHKKKKKIEKVQKRQLQVRPFPKMIKLIPND